MQQKTSRRLTSDFRFEIYKCIFMHTIRPAIWIILFSLQGFDLWGLVYLLFCSSLWCSFQGAWLFEWIICKSMILFASSTVKRYHKTPELSRTYQLLANEICSILKMLVRLSISFEWDVTYQFAVQCLWNHSNQKETANSIFI